MCNKKERKRDKRWYLFPVSTLGAVYFVFCCSWRDGAGLFFFRGGTGQLFFFSEAGRGGCFFFPRRDGAVVFFSEAGRGGCFFFRGGTGWLFLFFFDGTGRGGVFYFFRGPGRDGCFWRWQFFWRDGAKSLHRPAKGGLNRPTSRPCKALNFSREKDSAIPFHRRP